MSNCRLEQHAVKVAFEVSGYNQVRAAQLMGVSRNTVRTLLKHVGVIA